MKSKTVCFLTVFLLLSVIMPVNADTRSFYLGNTQNDFREKPIEITSQKDCELVAKNYQKENGGDLIFVQPLKSNGAFDLGPYKGHWLNKAYSQERGTYFFDDSTKTFYAEKEYVVADFKNTWGKDVVVYNVNKERIPFALIYYY